MATSATLQSFVANLVTRVPRRDDTLNVALPYSTSFIRHQRIINGRAQRVLKSTAEDMEQVTPATPTTETSPTVQEPVQSNAPTPKPKVSTKLYDVLSFSGPAPERINGRLAMVGFVAAMAAEVVRGEDVAAQLANGGVTWFVGTTAVLTLASLVPLLRGVSVEAKSGGLMTSDAELWNGRFAMLGLVALVLTEYVKGGALV
ncbi:hypothetical protein Scep_030141 [Stephania cephalantha]|uniref:Early light-induced protein n=1 Tax=Stephania cephalantha TaxID=152367 RepID=A0AAP0HIA0_9MAGN